jgi:hypothetical protein
MSDQNLAAAFVVLIKLKKRKRRWSKEWFKKRQKYTHEHLLRDLALTWTKQYCAILTLYGSMKTYGVIKFKLVQSFPQSLYKPQYLA